MEKTKYKFVETTGCTAFNYTINDQPISEIPKEELDKILDYLFVKIKEGIGENSILFENVVSLFQYDEYEHDDYRCESCGDHRSSTTWNI
jgi:hypothetical protein